MIVCEVDKIASQVAAIPDKFYTSQIPTRRNA
jgi:hypothetical protein